MMLKYFPKVRIVLALKFEPRQTTLFLYILLYEESRDRSGDSAGFNQAGFAAHSSSSV